MSTPYDERRASLLATRTRVHNRLMRGPKLLQELAQAMSSQHEYQLWQWWQVMVDLPQEW